MDNHTTVEYLDLISFRSVQMCIQIEVCESCKTLPYLKKHIFPGETAGWPGGDTGRRLYKNLPRIFGTMPGWLK